MQLAGFGDTYEETSGNPAIRAFKNHEPITVYASQRVLLETQLPLVSLDLCSFAYGGAAIGEGQLCAGFDQGRHDFLSGR